MTRLTHASIKIFDYGPIVKVKKVPEYMFIDAVIIRVIDTNLFQSKLIFI